MEKAAKAEAEENVGDEVVAGGFGRGIGVKTRERLKAAEEIMAQMAITEKKEQVRQIFNHLIVVLLTVCFSFNSPFYGSRRHSRG